MKTAILILVIVMLFFFLPIPVKKGGGKYCDPNPCFESPRASLFKIMMHSIQPDDHKWQY